MKLREFVSEHMVTQLLRLCKDELDISELPRIKLLDKPYLEGDGKRSFGMFTGDEIHVAINGRHPMDVLRTLAHELVHWKQRLEGQEMSGEDGSNTENDANAVAGVIMRRFSEKYPEGFVSSL
jgi:hypothetical protein